MVEGTLGVEGGAQRALVDLLEVGFPGLELGRRDVEGDGAGAQSKRVEAGVGIVDGGLEGVGGGHQLAEFRHSGAVDDLNAAVVRVGVNSRQERVADHPVQEAALRAAGNPFVETLVAGDIAARVHLAVAEMAPPGGRIVAVALAVHQPDGLNSGAGGIGGGGGELALVLVVDLHRLAEHRHILRRGLPSEVGVGEQLVITLERGEIVAVGVAMALGEHALGVGGIHHAILGAAAGFFLDVVIGGVEHLAAVDAAGVVPPQAVVGGGDAGAGIDEIIAALEQGEFLVERAGHLALEGETAGVHLGGRAGVVDGDRRVGGVRVGLVAEDGVEIVQIPGGEDERGVGRVEVDAGADGEALAAVEHGFINFNQADLVDIVEIQRNIALPAFSGLGEQGDIGVDRVAGQITHALVEGVDLGKHALDPTFHQDRRGPAGPGATDLAVVHGEVGIAHEHGGVADRGAG